MKEEDIAARLGKGEPVQPDEHAQFIESLLFLGHVSWELEDYEKAEGAHAKALGVARERLDDSARAPLELPGVVCRRRARLGRMSECSRARLLFSAAEHPVTTKALNAMINLKQKLAALQRFRR